MHELGIANSVLEAVQAEAARHPGAVPVKVALRVGELSGVDPDALSFSFEVLVTDTPWQRLAIEIETKPREHRCRPCGVTFRVQDYNFACPECGGFQTACVSGDELELAYLEFEEP
jgi:hydrogenase nickel incorporation protein HypA/HybF